MNTSRELMRQASRLYLLGRKIHGQQIELGKIIDKVGLAEGLSSERFLREYGKLQKLLSEFMRLEQALLAYREEYIRQRGGTPDKNHEGYSSAGRFGRDCTVASSQTGS